MKKDYKKDYKYEPKDVKEVIEKKIEQVKENHPVFPIFSKLKPIVKCTKTRSKVYHK